MVERRVSTAIGILCKLKFMAPVKILFSVYYAIVFPHLLWGCSSKNNLHKLQMLQNKCLRIIEGWQTKQKLEPLYIKFEIFNIDQQLNSCFCIKGKSYRNYLTFISIILKLSLLAKPGKRTRMICTSLYKTKRAQKSIKYIGVKIWNDIPLKIRTLPFNKFKQKYKLYLFQKSATTQK